MTAVGVDFGALHTGSAQLGAAAETFGQSSGQVGGTPGAAAPDPAVAGLLDRVREAIANALGQAAAELGERSNGLTATAASYERTEEALTAWQVPGGTSR